MRKLASISPGAIFNFAGEKFVVLEQHEGTAFVLLAQSKVSCPFNDKADAEDRNNYIGSTLEERTNQWVEKLPRNEAEAAAILPFDVDLSCTDRSTSYGTITVKAAPLTLWQYGQFKELIPLNEDDWWWLVTPWACRWLRSPYTGSTNYVWDVYTGGNYSNGSASNSYGIRPALLLMWECEKCGKHFCAACFVAKAGEGEWRKMLSETDNVFCPDCFQGEGQEKEFRINIKETLEMQVTIEADTIEEALKIAEERWKDGCYILDGEHFKGVEFEGSEV